MNKANTKKKDHSTRVLLPAVIFVAAVTQIPFVVTIIFSFLKWNVKRPDLGIKFNGVKNFVDVLTAKNFYIVLKNTLVIIIVCLVLCTVLAILLGVLFNRKFPGGYFFRTLLVMPYFVMDSVVGIVWKTLLLNPSMGLNYYISKFFGIQPIDFFGKHSLATVVILIIWQWTPFFFLIIMAGLQNIPDDVIESAKIDGANGLRRLISIDIPIIKKHIITAMTLGLINILKVFGLVYVTTQGGPGVSSANLPYLTYRTVFYDWSVGKAAAIAVVTVAITLFITQKFFKATNKEEE
ncbi:MAG: sugar ABC transporter permease [Coprococcus sp.]|nr:sugar ABC transporter permease [Coprococcus sp.]